MSATKARAKKPTKPAKAAKPAAKPSKPAKKAKPAARKVAASKPAAQKPAAKKPAAKKPSKAAAKSPAAKPAKAAKPAAKPSRPSRSANTRKPANKPSAPPLRVVRSSVASHRRRSKNQRDKSYLSAQELKYFINLFKQMYSNIAHSKERLMDSLKDEPNVIADENDRASKESEFAVELQEREREHRLLSKVKSAIERIEDKSFGYCEECDEPIGLERLKARPVATLCVECKNLQEQVEKSGSN